MKERGKVGTSSMHGEMWEMLTKFLSEKVNGCDRRKCLWENTIKMDLSERCDAVDWIKLAQNRACLLVLLNVLKNLRVLLKEGNVLNTE
jgi:hypothetical protein